MVTAQWNGTTIATSDDIAHVEGNAYFLLADVAPGVLVPSQNTAPTYCHWKGIAGYYDVIVDGKTCQGGAFNYAKPYPDAERIRDRVAFWNGVTVSDGPEGPGYVEPLPSQIGDRQGWEALCWLIKFAEEKELGAQEIERRAGIRCQDLASVWQVYDVQRYASVYPCELQIDANDATQSRVVRLR